MAAAAQAQKPDEAAERTGTEASEPSDPSAEDADKKRENPDVPAEGSPSKRIRLT